MASFLTLNKDQARRQAWYRQQAIRDDFFAFLTWPFRIQHIALKKHRNNQDRMTFCGFLKGNGMATATAKRYLLHNDVYDTSGINSINLLLSDEYAFGPKNRTEYWDMSQRQYSLVRNNERVQVARPPPRVEPLHGPKVPNKAERDHAAELASIALDKALAEMDLPAAPLPIPQGWMPIRKTK